MRRGLQLCARPLPWSDGTSTGCSGFNHLLSTRNEARAKGISIVPSRGSGIRCPLNHARTHPSIRTPIFSPQIRWLHLYGQEHMLCRRFADLRRHAGRTPTRSRSGLHLRDGLQPLNCLSQTQSDSLPGITPTSKMYDPGWVPQRVYLKTEGTFKSLGVDCLLYTSPSPRD